MFGKMLRESHVKVARVSHSMFSSYLQFHQNHRRYDRPIKSAISIFPIALSQRCVFIYVLGFCWKKTFCTKRTARIYQTNIYSPRVPSSGDCICENMIFSKPKSLLSNRLNIRILLKTEKPEWRMRWRAVGEVSRSTMPLWLLKYGFKTARKRAYRTLLL